MSEKMFPLPPKGEPEKGKLTPEQDEVLEKVARKVVEKRMTVPALMFIESVKPLNFIGSQVMVFFEPIVQTLFDFKSYTVFREVIEDRDNVELLMQKIEKHDAKAVKLEKAYKIMKKQHFKDKSFWYKLKMRFIGYRVPTEEVKEFAKKLEEERKEAAQSREDKIGKTGFDKDESRGSQNK
ncbi:MAG: hypothetical protein GWO41_10245 [candidate division Zixibacteria bacterium]|nr:hypothetical protein [candidate division Zixibacteria bacterium]NIR64587.1 hypothetical protein [candidate division Zixibacteria bacterium]NIS16710.1 hypothetical protein [candidate division Zixibacteria bacterium]NIS46445.1 hypothetical protein [candidate division Zixibacteria bacterium]NIT53099.1 hypothetical protein [candidate division Zixibacteria bacterium]